MLIDVGEVADWTDEWAGIEFAGWCLGVIRQQMVEHGSGGIRSWMNSVAGVMSSQRKA